MDEAVARALHKDKVVDITTTGRRSGRPQRIEIWFHRADGRYVITGQPGRRSWYANLLADARLTFHLKESLTADLPARARAVTDPEEKRRLLLAADNLQGFVTQANVEEWVRGSPLVEVVFQEATP